MSDQERQNDEGRDAQEMTWEDIKALRRVRASIMDKLSDHSMLQSKLRETDEALNGKIKQLLEMLQPSSVVQTPIAASPAVVTLPVRPAVATPIPSTPRNTGSPLLRRLVSVMSKSKGPMTVPEIIKATGLKKQDRAQVYNCLRYNSLSGSALVKRTVDGRYRLA